MQNIPQDIPAELAEFGFVGRRAALVLPLPDGYEARLYQRGPQHQLVLLAPGHSAGWEVDTFVFNPVPQTLTACSELQQALQLSGDGVTHGLPELSPAALSQLLAE